MNLTIPIIALLGLFFLEVIPRTKKGHKILEVFWDTMTDYALRTQKFCTECWKMGVNFQNRGYTYTKKFLVLIDRDTNTPMVVPEKKLYFKDEKNRLIAAVLPEVVYKEKAKDGKIETIVFNKRDRLIADRNEKITKALYVKPVKPKITVQYGERKCNTPRVVSPEENEAIKVMSKQCLELWFIDHTEPVLRDYIQFGLEKVQQLRVKSFFKKKNSIKEGKRRERIPTLSHFLSGGKKYI